jgi:hypothetical protein
MVTSQSRVNLVQIVTMAGCSSRANLNEVLLETSFAIAATVNALQ